MSYHLQAFPILYLNMGGELMYIIEQRLQAQEISADKSSKVLNDLLSAMLKRQYVSGIFRPGKLHPQSAMKDLIESIVHASIMRLGQDSLDKLYELIVMSIKYQIFSACDPQLMLSMTVNHVESWTELTTDPEIMLQIQYAKDTLLAHYAKLSSWGWLSIRHILLNFLQPCKTRVTTFLNRGMQSQSGYFYLDFKRCLPDGLTIPKLYGKDKPYEKIECNSVPTVNLGTNMFNETRQAPVLRIGGLKSLERLIVQPSENEPKPQEKMSSDEIVSTDQNSLQLELKVTPAQKEDVTQIAEETLLDLFDQACLAEEQ